MAISVFDLFKIGIGPSSSHTVGPIRAAGLFVDDIAARGLLAAVSRVQIQLFGSLGATGRGHGTDMAVMLGLEGETPERVETDTIPTRLETLRQRRRLQLPDGPEISFDPDSDLKFYRNKTLPYHPNGLRFHAYDADDGAGGQIS